MTMKAVVFHGAFDVKVEDRPKPTIKDDTDALVKVELAGLCGSELHMFRGHQKTKTGHIMGHEFVGVVDSVGPKVTKYKPGDRVVSVFATVCQTCWFCQRGLGNRCANSLAFGTQQLDGGQAEYVRVPFAEGTLQHVPPNLDERLLVMMCDIFPTGYYGAMRAIEFIGKPLLPQAVQNGSGHEKRAATFEPQALKDTVFVVLGCGPVGICAVLTALSKGVGTVYVVDAVDERLAEAEAVGGKPLKLGRDDIQEIVMKATDGRGADAVVEVVGNKPALKSAIDLVRVCGIISSIGFHQSELPFTAFEAYQKNVTLNFGRAPISTLFPEALECLRENKEKVAAFISHEIPLAQAPHGYDIFEKYQARKVVFKV
ncbi:GroES-like protein [Lophium mytilinum]|uniref:GroES-like protein n=1 Tax=Lophium mytilinum TaxID=390894 RepID=A0A6A6R4W2_9PEZI|nr:GroES-like protein [Lophium mytilinum]